MNFLVFINYSRTLFVLISLSLLLTTHLAVHDFECSWLHIFWQASHPELSLPLFSHSRILVPGLTIESIGSVVLGLPSFGHNSLQAVEAIALGILHFHKEGPKP